MLEQFSCAQCQKTPALKEKYACGRDTRSKRPVFEIETDEGEILRYWNCPLNFVPVSVWEFCREYRYRKDFPSVPMPDYDGVSTKWVEAYQTYESKLNAFQMEKLKRV